MATLMPEISVAADRNAGGVALEHHHRTEERGLFMATNED
jgi:hypothetical protein